MESGRDASPQALPRTGLVYTMAFKLLGILLALVEMGWFIVRPVAAEVRLLWARRRDLRPNLAMVRSAALVVAAAAIMAVPWRGTVHGDALVGAERRAMLFAPAASQVVEVTAAPGMRAAEGQSLFRLHSPSLAHGAAQLRQAVDSLALQAAALSSQQDSAARAHLLGLERETVRQSLASAEAAIAQLDLRAPFAGEVVELADPLQRLEWVERGEPLALLVDCASTLAEALVSEQDLRRIAVGAQATIRPRNPDLPAILATVEAIDTSALRTLPSPPPGAGQSPHGRKGTARSCLRLQCTASACGPRRTSRWTAWSLQRSGSTQWPRARAHASGGTSGAHCCARVVSKI